MRPVRLQMQGFGPFREPVDVDFSDIDYVALVGPTGSGKSTVIDAMCFALYGSVPRYDNDNRVGYAITAGATEARVSFTFDAGGRRYTATRVVRRRPDGGANTREARLEAEAGRGEPTEVLAGTVRGLDALVKDRVLGMGFDHFRRCVVLPQGEFARFLSDKPRDRQDMLVRLLGLEVYARMGHRAGQLKLERERHGAELRGEAAGLAFATPAAAAALGARLTDLEKLNEQLDGARTELAELARRAEEAHRAAEEAGRLANALEALRAPEELDRAGAEISRRHAEEDAATAALQAAGAALAAAQQRLDELGDRALLEAAADRYRRHRELAGALAEVAAALEEARTGRLTAARALADAAATEGSRQVELEELALAHRAHFLAERLAVGAPCPVCQQAVITQPPLARLPAADAAKAALAEARAAVEAAQAADSEAQQAAATAAERHRGLAALDAQLRAELSGAPPEAEVEARLAAIGEAAAAAAGARQAEAAARQAVEAARAGRVAAEEAVSRLWQAFDAARDGIAGLFPPAPGRRDIAGDWAALLSWAEGEALRRRAAQAEAAAAASAGRAAAERILTRLRTACAGAGVAAEAVSARLGAGAPGPGAAAGLERLVRAVMRAEATARADLGNIRRALTRLDELAGGLQAADEEAAVARDLARHLGSRGFERWMLAEVVEGLVAGASEILRSLSSGAYSLATEPDGEFSVIDHGNADERRSAKTLSGGETFQASLALALALAEQLSSLAAAGAARIEATFIDEGFGSLDPETLETVAGTLENMGGDDRMVGIVTHVRELAERVPVRLEVSRGPRTAAVTKVLAE